MTAVKKIAAAAVAALFLVAGVSAQETRSVIFGRVTDPQDAAVAGATVVVTNADTNTNMTLVTNETGYYEANLLLAGNYRVTVEISSRSRFVPASCCGEHPLGGEHQAGAGWVAESVSVTAGALLTPAASVPAAMENRSVNDLPTFNNSPLVLIKLVPGVQASNNRATSAQRSAARRKRTTRGTWATTVHRRRSNMGANYSAACRLTRHDQEFKVETISTPPWAPTGSTISVTKAAPAAARRADRAALAATLERHALLRQANYCGISLAAPPGTRPANQLRASPPSPGLNNLPGLRRASSCPKSTAGKTNLLLFS
jgi:hypothetical protein